MFLHFFLTSCIESFYDPSYTGESLSYSRNNRNVDLQLNKNKLDRKFEDEFKESTSMEKQENNDLNNLKEYNEFDNYKNQLYKIGQKRTARPSLGLPFEFKFPLTQEKELFNNPATILPQQQSISRSILFTSKNLLPMILSREFGDISQDLNTKLTNTIYNTRRANIDHDKFRELIVIKKRILSDGKHKVVDMDVSGRVVPRNVQESNLRLFLACIIFLLACILFTATMKFYKSYLKIKKIDPYVVNH